MLAPRGGLTAAVVGGRIHVGGGEALDPRRAFAEHEVFAPVANRWKQGTSLPTAHHGLASAGAG